MARQRKNRKSSAPRNAVRVAPARDESHLISIARMIEHAGTEVSSISFRGAVRPNTQDGFRSFLVRAGARSPYLLVHLAELDYLSSTGLGTLLEQARLQAQEGGWLRVVAPSRAVRMILGLSGSGETLAVLDDDEDALRDLSPKAA